MFGWHHWLNGHEFERAPGDGEGQWSLASCNPWDHNELYKLGRWTTTTVTSFCGKYHRASMSFSVLQGECYLDVLTLMLTLVNAVNCYLLGLCIIKISLWNCFGRNTQIVSCSRGYHSMNLWLDLSVLVSLREGDGTPLQYSCLENPMDGGAWWAAVRGVARSRTWLSDFPFPFHFHALEKEMATHSSVLAWRIPRTAEPGGLPSMGLHWVGHDWSDLAAAAAASYNPIIALLKCLRSIHTWTQGGLSKGIHASIVCKSGTLETT